MDNPVIHPVGRPVFHNVACPCDLDIELVAYIRGVGVINIKMSVSLSLVFVSRNAAIWLLIREVFTNN